MFNWFKRKKYSQEELDTIAKKAAIEAAKNEAKKIWEMIGRNELDKSIGSKDDYDALKEALSAFSKTVVAAGITDSDFQQYDSNDTTNQFGTFKINMLKFFNSYQRMMPQEAGMLSRHWLVGKAISMPIKTALRRGFKIDGENKKELEKEVKRHKLYVRLAELGIYARSMGGALMLFKTYDPDKFSEYSEQDYYLAPFNIDSIHEGNKLSISVFDSFFAQAQADGEGFTDPLSDYFYDPEFYSVRGLKIHRSHFVKYVSYDVPQFMKPYYFFYGISVPERVMEKVYAAESSQLEGLALLKTKRLLTLQIPDLVDRDETQVTRAMTMIANALPKIGKKQAYIAVGDRTSYTYTKNELEITINNVLLVSKNIEIVEDHRGEKYFSTNDGSEIEIKEFGSLPPTITTIPRPDIWHVYIDGEWVMTAEKEVEKAEYEKQQKIASLNAELNQLKQDMVFAQIMGDDISEMKGRVLEIRAELEKLQA